jgi:SNF2 family DNA or RNA helicase
MFSLFAFAEVRALLEKLDRCRLVIPSAKATDLHILGSDSDRPFRNHLQTRWLARNCSAWIKKNVEVRGAPSYLPQSAIIANHPDSRQQRIITGNCPFTTDGFGLTPGNQFSLIQCAEGPEESAMLGSWFAALWNSLPSTPEAKNNFLASLLDLASHRDPFTIYTLILHHLFKDRGEELDEDQVVKSATGIRNSVVWKKLFRFQRDGVVGAIDKLNRFGGCIIADSVGLGKTFEALAIIKYHELRNDRVLVLCPKRLRDNWTIYKANDRRNILAADRLNYDVLNHTDLSRDGGSSGDIDLAHVNWGNYDLIVIDESHNFRNKSTHKGKESRYDRLMRKIIKEGVKTRVLMLSATPVNNRLADLRNQIAFATEGDDTALLEYGITSIDSTTRLAQKQFNRWLELEEAEKTPSQLIEMLGFDYFTLLDQLTIARSRKHIEKYYGISETGRFPERLRPINIKPDVDRAGEFRSIRDINTEIRRLNLASYAPLRYVLPHKQAAYDAKYSTQIRGGESFFRQVDREESLIHLLRVNVLKRMESAVSSFALTVQRQLHDVEDTLARIAAFEQPDYPQITQIKADDKQNLSGSNLRTSVSSADKNSFEEIDIADVDIDDPAFECLLVGRKVKVLLQDVDLIRWKQDLIEDRNRLATLHAAAKQVGAARDAKLSALREVISHKCNTPINKGNRKVIVFTAFADTAHYLYEHLAEWSKETLGIETALVTGSGRNQTTLTGLRKDLATILTTFSPRSKERPEDLAHEGELDLLIATDCISEGQNLQDCDWLVNYDIHWNPVRIIQRFGRIDRIGSPNDSIQLVNFWPNMELEEYINLEQRVSGRMVLLDISATGEENLIEQQSGNQMNDLEYRRKQLLKLQDAVIDLEDLSTGVSITDLTLTDFRIDLAQYRKAHPDKLDQLPLGTSAVTTTTEIEIPPGIIFCLRAEGAAAAKVAESGYPLAPHYLVHVGDDGTVLLPYTQAKRILDHLKRLSLGRDLPDASACAGFDKTTKQGEDMRHAQRLLAASVASVVGKSEERAVASLFSPGGTHAIKGEFAGINDFEVVAYLVVLPGEER